MEAYCGVTFHISKTNVGELRWDGQARSANMALCPKSISLTGLPTCVSNQILQGLSSGFGGSQGSLCRYFLGTEYRWLKNPHSNASVYPILKMLPPIGSCSKQNRKVSSRLREPSLQVPCAVEAQQCLRAVSLFSF